jgi:hypothetical protein
MEFQNGFISCRVDTLSNCKSIRISGIIVNRSMYRNVMIMAANPANSTASYSATGLPFPCADIAFQGTNNIYPVDLSGNFDTIFSYPNSYYSVANKKKIISSIFFILEDLNGKTEFVRFQLNDLYPLRTLVNRESRTGPEFYDLKHQILPVDTAEVVAREYAQIKSIYNIA